MTQGSRRMPRKRTPYEKTEAGVQCAIIRWCRDMARVNPKKYGCLAKIYHCPNGGKRDSREAAHLRRMGTLPGIPDLHLPVARHGYNSLYIELKVGSNKLTVNQREMITWLNQEGNKAVVCYGFDSAIEEIEGYLG